VSISQAKQCLRWAVAVHLWTVHGLAAATPPPGGDSRSNSTRFQEPALSVLAASSLQEVLPAVAMAWERSGGVPVRFRFDATSRLAPQLFRGAPADVFVSADIEWMRWLEERGSVDPASVRSVATNQLVFAVPRSTAFTPRDPSGLRDPDVHRIALAGEDVPAGRYAKAALESSGMWDVVQDRIVRGGSVRGALQWVARGEADGGVVYRSDALAESEVRIAFMFPSEDNAAVVYPAAVVTGSPNTEAADAFLDFLEGPDARQIFATAGFGGQGGSGPTVAAQRPEPGLTLDPWSAVRLSLLVALGAVVLGLVPAAALGWVLARHDFVGKSFVSMLFMAPLVIPPVVTGFLLLGLLGRQSALGGMLDALGLPVPFTVLGAIVAALVVGFPLYVMAIRGAFEAVDRRFEEVSWTLGVPRAPTFRRVSLPLALPGIAAGGVLAFARALGEFGATVVLAGNLEGETRTIALAVYSLLESPSGRGATWTLVAASVTLSLMALLGFESLSRWQRRRLGDYREY